MSVLPAMRKRLSRKNDGSVLHTHPFGPCYFAYDRHTAGTPFPPFYLGGEPCDVLLPSLQTDDDVLN